MLRIGWALLDLSIFALLIRHIVITMQNDLTVSARDSGAAGSASRLDTEARAHVDDGGAAGVDS